MTQISEQVTSGTASGPRRRGHTAIAITVALLGFLLAIQLRSQQGLADRLAVEREEDLGQILTELTARSDRLLEEIVDLRVSLAKTEGTEERERALVDAAREQLRALQVLLGVVPVKGQGIVVTIDDPQSAVGSEVLLDAVQELRDAGAEAIEVNRVRVVASTAFTGEPGALIAGAARLTRPYVIEAIGSPATLAEAMRIPGGVVDALAARAGASVRIEESSSVSILSVSTLPAFRHATPSPRR